MLKALHILTRAMLYLLCALLVCSAAAAQPQNEFHFAQPFEPTIGSHLILSYRIPNDSVYRIALLGGPIDPATPWLQHPAFAVDAAYGYRTDSILALHTTATGYYLQVSANRNMMVLGTRRVKAFYTYLTDLQRVKLLCLRDTAGNPIRNAELHLGKKTIPYDAGMAGYVLKGFKDGDLLRIDWGGDVEYQRCTVQQNEDYEPPHRRNETSDAHERNRQYDGYLVTNMPKYRRGDTLKWKAYLLDPAEDRTVREPLRITFAEDRNVDYYGNGKQYKVAAKYRPQEPGVYYGEFVLGDSVTTGTIYTLELYGTKSACRITATFKVDDYLLDETYLRVTGDGRPTYQPGDSINLYAFAYNSNNLPVLDGTISMAVLATNYEPAQKVQMFIPDTVYKTTLPVNADGETNIGFSTAAFPTGLRSMRCFVSLVNSNYERKDTAFDIAFTNDARYLHITPFAGNKLRVELISNKQSVPGRGSYMRQRASFNAVEQPITYPFEYTIDENDAALYFILKDDKGTRLSSINYYVPTTALSGEPDFVGDTASLLLHNPAHVLYRYSIFSGRDFVGYGYTRGDTLIKLRSSKGKTVSIIGSYMWAGQSIDRRFDIFKFDKELRIALNKKDLVYPGQHDTLTVHLSDRDEKGIGATNVTVLAFNSQFAEDYTKDIPYGGLLYPPYAARRTRDIEPVQLYYFPTRYATREWLQRCAADTMFYYQNLYLLPADIAWLTYDLPQPGPSQFAIYAQRDHEWYEPEIIYVDDRPAYMRHAASVSPHSFLLQPGTHQLRFRLRDAEYYMPQVDICAGMKNILFIRTDSVGPFPYKDTVKGKVYDRQRNNHTYTFITARSMPDTLQYWEKDALANVLLLYRPEYSSNYRQWKGLGDPQFLQYPVQLRLPNDGRYNVYEGRYNQGYESGIRLLGPINFRDSVYFFQKFNTKLRFLPERGYIFSFRPQMTRVEKASPYDYLRYRLDLQPTWPMISFLAPAPEDFDTFRVEPITRPVEQVLVDNKLRTVKFAAPVDKRISFSVGYAPAQPDAAATSKVRIARKDSMIRYVFYSRVGKGKQPVLSTTYYDGQVLKTAPGTYRLLVVWNNDKYSIFDSIRLRPNGITILPLSYSSIRGTFDGIKAPHWVRDYLRFDTLKNRDYQFYSSRQTAGLSGMGGTLKDEKGYPVVNANVTATLNGIIKGQTITDFDGEFVVKPLEPGVYNLRFTYQSNQLTITGITLKPNQLVTVNGKLPTAKSLNGVTVRSARAYNKPLIDARSSGTASRTADQIDKAPSRSITHYENVTDIASLPTQSYEGADFRPFKGNVYIGGARSSGTNYIVDGVQLNELASTGDGIEGMIKGLTKSADDGYVKGGYLNRDKSAAFFSSFMSNMMGASGMRKQFRDWAIWEPDLWTNGSGDARFEVTYPGNLTSWKTYVLAMNRKGYAGKILTLTRAFKPLSAQLVAPRFLRYGDTAEGLGKVANYTQQPFHLKTAFTAGSSLLNGDTLQVHNTRVSHLNIAAPTANVIDTAQFPVSYSITADNGYMDGEEHIIPVLPVGITESRGHTLYLTGDTAFTSTPDTAAGHFTGHARVYVDGSLLDVMLREIENLKVYPHGCNEQLTTMLLAIYYEEEIKRLTGNTAFNNTKAKRRILDQLVRAQLPNGSFGWWNSNAYDARITNYVISTMQKVNKDGWLDFIVRRGLAYLAAHLEDMDQSNQIAAMGTLSIGHYAANYKPVMQKLDSARLSTYDRLALIKVCREQGLPYRAGLDSMMKLRQESIHGSFWSSNARYDWYRDDLATTLMAYSVIRGDSIYGHLTPSIMRYILFRRSRGYYDNTASSGLVLITILPDLLNGKPLAAHKKPAYLTIRGSIKDSTTAFPKMYKVKEPYPAFTFEKKGIAPVFVSTVYEYFNTSPLPYNSDFRVRTYFLNAKHDTVTALRAGERITLRTVVTCKKEAEYVMITVPIPAGCIQVDKGTQYYRYGEAARENFKDQTDVFSDRLEEGTYTYDVELEARFKGVYNVSPAAAGMMYYPEEWGNTAVKKVQIR